MQLTYGFPFLCKGTQSPLKIEAPGCIFQDMYYTIYGIQISHV